MFHNLIKLLTSMSHKGFIVSFCFCFDKGGNGFPTSILLRNQTCAEVVTLLLNRIILIAFPSVNSV